MSTVAAPQAPKPTLPQIVIPLTHEVVIGEEKRKLKMSFAKLNRICQIVGNIHAVDQIIMDPTVSQAVLMECLANKKEKVDLDEIDISMEESAKVIAWAGTHVLDFFIKLGDNFQKMSQPVVEAAAAVAKAVEEAAAKAGSQTS